MRKVKSLKSHHGISLYLQGTQCTRFYRENIGRYIPVPTGNASRITEALLVTPVYPCTYRELDITEHDSLIISGISLYLQGTLAPYFRKLNFLRYIPVPTGNSRLIFLLE